MARSLLSVLECRVASPICCMAIPKNATRTILGNLDSRQVLLFSGKELAAGHRAGRERQPTNGESRWLDSYHRQTRV